MTWWDDANNDATAIVNRERLIVEQQDETFRFLWDVLPGVRPSLFVQVCKPLRLQTMQKAELR